jgi:hypothetical protein
LSSSGTSMSGNAKDTAGKAEAKADDLLSDMSSRNSRP